MDDEIVPLRLIKTDDELDAIGRACALADAGFAHLLEFVQPGMTEQRGRLGARGVLPGQRRRWPRLPDDRPRRPARRDAARPALRRDDRARQRPAPRLRLHRRRVSVRHDAHPVRRRRARPRAPRSRRGSRGPVRRDGGHRRRRQRPGGGCRRPSRDHRRGVRAVRARARPRHRPRGPRAPVPAVQPARTRSRPGWSSASSRGSTSRA